MKVLVNVKGKEKESLLKDVMLFRIIHQCKKRKTRIEMNEGMGQISLFYVLHVGIS